MSNIRRNRRQRARRQLFWAAGVFLLLQQVACLLLDYRWPEVRFPWAHERFHAAGSGIKPDIVYLGSSRLLTTLSAEHLQASLASELGEAAPTVFDATVPSGDSIVMEYMFNELERRGMRPKLAVLEVLPETFQRRNERCRMHLERHWRWEDLPIIWDDLWFNGQIGRFLRCRLLPIYAHRYALAKAVAAGVESWWSGDAGAEAPRAGRWAVEDEQAALASAAAQYSAARVREVRDVRAYLHDYQVGGGTVAALQRMLTCCRTRRIEVLLLAPPVAGSHRACYSPDIEAEFQRQVRRLVDEYGCRFADCRAYLPDTLFFDHHHGTPEAALVFSRRLGREVLAPLFESRQSAALPR